MSLKNDHQLKIDCNNGSSNYIVSKKINFMYDTFNILISVLSFSLHLLFTR